MLECAFCGVNLSRRSWNSGTDYQKTIWQCVAATKHGKSNCPHSKGIEESVIEEAFVKSYNILCKDNQNIIENFVAGLESSLKNEIILYARLAYTSFQNSLPFHHIETLEVQWFDYPFPF